VIDRQVQTSTPCRRGPGCHPPDRVISPWCLTPRHRRFGSDSTAPRARTGKLTSCWLLATGRP
jgi:hypothetical protein